MNQTAPCFSLKPENLHQILECAAIKPEMDSSGKIDSIASFFSQIPYENLTKIIKSDAVINARSAMRYPDELLSDWMRWGTGGTCFSLTAAMTAVFIGAGIEAHPVLADRHYGVNTHCGCCIITPNGPLLLDPGYLLFKPTLLPTIQSVAVDTGYNIIELIPIDGGKRVAMYTSVRGNRKLRLTYKPDPVDASEFEKAWEHSFSWEMMTYPVLTRVSARQHIYLQGDALSIRTSQSTRRQKMDQHNQLQCITGTIGIHHDIAKKALEILNHG
jgi:arylamine N-acetyltransferase